MTSQVARLNSTSGKIGKRERRQEVEISRVCDVTGRQFIFASCRRSASELRNRHPAVATVYIVHAISHQDVRKREKL